MIHHHSDLHRQTNQTNHAPPAFPIDKWGSLPFHQKNPKQIKCMCWLILQWSIQKRNIVVCYHNIILLISIIFILLISIITKVFSFDIIFGCTISLLYLIIYKPTITLPLCSTVWIAQLRAKFMNLYFSSTFLSVPVYISTQTQESDRDLNIICDWTEEWMIPLILQHRPHVCLVCFLHVKILYSHATT